MTSAHPASPTPALSPLPAYAQRSFADLAEDLRRSEGRATVLIGAGCSFSGGIPLAGGIIDDIRKQFPQAWNRAQKKAAECGQLSPNYNLCMQALLPDQRRTLLKHYIDGSKINWAHIGLAQLLKHGHLDRVLTTNFDQLITRACALVNVFPAVYDLTAFSPAQMRMAELPDLAVFHLHGQRNGFSLLNDPDELAQHARQLKPLFDHARERRLWIVVGYSGEADPLLALIQAERHECGLYWISTQPAPKPHLAELFTPERYAFHVHHPEGGADHFFMKLALEMDVWPPTLMDQPFAHLREQLAPIAKLIPDGKQNDKPYYRPYYRDEPNGFDWLENVHSLLNRAEELLKMDVSTQNELHRVSDDMNLYLADGVKGLQRSPNPKVRSWGCLIEGNDLASQVTQKMIEDNLPLAKYIWQQACDMYSRSLELNPNQEDAAFNWGCTLGCEALALIKSDLSSARGLILQAGDKYAKALRIDPGSYQALSNWGLLLSLEAHAIADNDPLAARELWKKSGELYVQALKIKPDDYVAEKNFGIGLLHEYHVVNAKCPQEAQMLLEQAKAHFQQAEAFQLGKAAYNLACVAALQHRPAEAIHWLRTCQAHGTLPTEDHLRTDAALDPIRDTPEFTTWWAESFAAI